MSYYDTSYPPSLWAPAPPVIIPATGATAGIPGTWTPAGCTIPADVASIGSVVATPATAWTTGQYVQTATIGTTGRAHWSGTAWVAGAAAVADEETQPEAASEFGEPVYVDEIPPDESA